jgi:predicted transcriptional regulator
MPKKGQRPPVTPAEFRVLQVLWELGVGTVAAIHGSFPRSRPLAYNTVLTQVRLLHSKGYLQREAVGRAHVYRSRFDRDQVLERVLKAFAEDYFEGDCTGLAAFLAESGLAEPARSEPNSALLPPSDQIPGAAQG